MIVSDIYDSSTKKQHFYAIASKAEKMDRIAKARFDREPWYLTDKKIREGRESNGSAESSSDEYGRV